MRASAILTALILVLAAACADQPTQPGSSDDVLSAQTSFVFPRSSEELLTFTVVDPRGDQAGNIDVIRMEVDFDPVTGGYEIRLDTDPARPFHDDFRVNVNLFNATDTVFFTDNVNDFDLASATSQLTLTDTSSLLVTWEPGDRVYTNDLCSQRPDPSVFCSTFDVPRPPPGFLFRSGVLGPGFRTEDEIAFADYAQPAVVEVLTPHVRLERLAFAVQVLVDAGVLGEGPGNGLLRKLDQVGRKIRAGQARSAAKQLRAFIQQVSGFVPTHLTPAQGQNLIGQAEALIVQLSH